MILEWRETRKLLVRYLLGYVLVCISLFVFIRWYQARNFSEAKLEYMLSTTSKSRDVTDDPCKYAIFGEPTTAQAEFVKVFVFCGSTKSLNSMDMRAIKDKSVGGAIRELGRVNGFPVKIEGVKISLGNKPTGETNSWMCLQNRVKVTDFNSPLIQKATIDCVAGLTDKGINNFYAAY